ncbi:hypothetical protein IMG5_072330, partial [Ichthyophthirius multifiliis]
QQQQKSPSLSFMPQRRISQSNQILNTIQQVDQILEMKQLKRLQINIILSKQQYDQKFEVNKQHQVQNQKKANLQDLELIQSQQLNKLVQIQVNVKLDNSKSFQKCLKQYLIILQKVNKSDLQIRLNALKVLRNISNFNKDFQIYESIQNDLCEIGFMKLLCNVIINEVNENTKTEFIIGLNDFMNESNQQIKSAFYNYLVQDENNQFLLTLQNFLLSSFKQFKEYIIQPNFNILNNQIKYNNQFQEYIKQKVKKSFQVLELIKLSCKQNYIEMQNFYRNQVNLDGCIKKQSINFIILISDIFSKYHKQINEENLHFGKQIIETLIQMIIGPCKENQKILAQSKIFENIQDIMNELFEKDIIKLEYQGDFIEFNNKILFLIYLLFEGNQDQQVIQKLCKLINPRLFYNQIIKHYKNYSQIQGLLKNKHKGLYLCSINFFSNKQKKNEFLSTLNIEQLDKFIMDNEKYLSKKYKFIESWLYQLKSQQLLSLCNKNYIIIQYLSFVNNTFKKMCKEIIEQQDEQLKKNIIQIKQQIVSIEIINQQNLVQKIYFPKDPLTQYLSKTTKERFLENAIINSANDKIKFLLSFNQIFQDEMKHFLKLRAIGIYFHLSIIKNAKNLNLFLIFIINLFLFFDQYDDNFICIFITYLQILSTFLILFFWMILKFPLEYFLSIFLFNIFFFFFRYTEIQRKYQSRIKKNKYQNIFRIYNFFKSSHILYLIINILVSVIGLCFSKIFYTFLLLDIIDRSPVLKNIIKPVTINAKQLLLSVIIGCTFLYIYSALGYYSDIKKTLIYTNNQNYEICSTPWDCFTFILGQALRQGGGIGDLIQMPDPINHSQYYYRFIYDLTFYLIINVIWLNIIFGIIIDAFAELRDAKNAKDFDQQNKCFICNLERDVFENQGLNFKKHRKKEHNIWNYIYYIVYLQQKDKNSFNGTDYYIQNKLKNDDITWYPIGRAIQIECLKDE